MRIGPLRHRVTIQQMPGTQDAAGEPTKTWSNIASIPSVWADVRPASASERFVGGGEQQQAIVTHNVTIRYRSDLNNRMRVVWNSINLDIEGITDPSGKREYLKLQCREVQV